MKRRSDILLLIGALAALAAAAPAVAQGARPAALVEDVSDGVKGVAVFDYLPAGTKIALGAAGKLTLGYLASCLEETIVGGNVTVGAEQSAVAGGSVQRKTVACAGRPLQLSEDQSGKSGGLVFRKPPNAVAAPAVSVVVHGTAPVIALPKAGHVVIERVDLAAAPIALDLPGKPVDLATRNVRLDPGGTYRASYGPKAITFRVDSQGGDGSALGRLIQF